MYNEIYNHKSSQNISKNLPKRPPKSSKMVGQEPGKSTSNKNSLPGLVFSLKMSSKSIQNDSRKASKWVITPPPDHEIS